MPSLSDNFLHFLNSQRYNIGCLLSINEQYVYELITVLDKLGFLFQIDIVDLLHSNNSDRVVNFILTIIQVIIYYELLSLDKVKLAAMGIIAVIYKAYGHYLLTQIRSEYISQF